MAKECIEKEAALAIIARKQNNSLNDVVDDACGQLYAEINSLPTQEDKSDTHLLSMLLEAINYVYKQLDGKYGNLSYVVSDKVKYIERVRAEKIEQKKREKYETSHVKSGQLPAERIRPSWEAIKGKIDKKQKREG